MIWRRTLPVDPAPLVAVTPGGEKSFAIEVADDAGERSSGLMFRETMADDRGMLFVFEQTQPVGFWMKNTPMPLDLIFIAEDGTVRAVKQGMPLSEAVISPGEPVRFVLELKAGTAEKAGIVDGKLASSHHPAIGTGVREVAVPNNRGLDMRNTPQAIWIATRSGWAE